MGVVRRSVEHILDNAEKMEQPQQQRRHFYPSSFVPLIVVYCRLGGATCPARDHAQRTGNFV